MKKLKNLFDASMLRFVIVGVINTVVGTSIMYGLYNLAHFSYWFSSAANYTLTSILSFFLNKHFTFKVSQYSVAEVLRFIANILVCYLLAYGIAKPLTHALLAGQTQSLRDNAAMFVGMCFFTVFNYLGQRFFTFKQNRNAGDN